VELPGYGGKDDVGTASAGCLVGEKRDGHRAFMAVIKPDPRSRANNAYKFMPAVIPGHEALAPVADLWPGPELRPCARRVPKPGRAHLPDLSWGRLWPHARGPGATEQARSGTAHKQIFTV
jgi:hypothetical protein